ncbi:MAG TPA: hypothetical protein VJZ01_03275 [Lachnospiraceae bacterium]|mgnify:CR=1 FL=1|jgi:hypothetical protein|nr:hypothetical protein [Lachnospiraceae bacterium]
MAINGLSGQYDLFQNFNSQNALSKLPTIGQDEPKVQEQQAPLREQEQEAAPQAAQTLSPAQEDALGLRSAVSNLEDISLDFNPNAETNLVGRDSNLADLDVEKAISDMKKDSILEQYQYFVGDSKTSLVNDEDGLVFQKFPMDLF